MTLPTPPRTRRVPDLSHCFAALADQFARSWAMLRDVVARFPEQAWYQEALTGMVPARRAYHLVYWADAYQRRARTEPAGALDPDEADVRLLPTQADLLAHADEVAARMDQLLRSSSAGKLLAPYRTRRTGAHLYERLIYVLRHNMEHIGELQAMLRALGREPADWR